MNLKEFALTEISMKAHQMTGWDFNLPEPQEMMDLYTPMKFAKKVHKTVSIRDRVSQCEEVSNMRHVLMLGVHRLTMRYSKPMTFHELVKNGSSGCLTSDRPVEVYEQFLSFSKAHGRVLVGGLGLGMAAAMIAENTDVKTVTVVEKDPDVIALIGQNMEDRGIEVVKADLFSFLKKKENAGKFDFAYHDVWYGTGEAFWSEHVAPLTVLSRKAGIKEVGAWGEYQMIWQLRSALFTRAKLPLEASKWRPYQVFIDGLRKKFGQKPPFPDDLDEQIAAFVKMYLTELGTPHWNKIWKWPGV